MIQEKIRIINKLGLHARAAAKFVSHTSRYISDILVLKNDQQANGKSIMGVMMLAASQGTELELHISGEDEKEMFEDLKTLINSRFGESE